MPLLGWPLLAVLSLVALASVVGALLLWGRVPGPKPLQMLLRFLMIAVCQLTAVLFVAAVANDYGYFYTSWSEIVGTSASGGPPAAGGAYSGRAGASSVRAPRPGLVVPHPTVAGGTMGSAATWAVSGRITSVDITGAVSGLTDNALVWFPPQYFQRSFAHRLFPGVEVLTGYPGNNQSLLRRQHYPEILMKEIKAGKAAPMILVMMRSTVAPPRDTECTDVPAGPQALTYLARDVPQALRSSIRVRPFGWGVVGDSTGGLCAAKITMIHPDVFSAGVALSGYFHNLQDHTTGDLWHHSAAERDLNDVRWRLQHLPPPPVSLLLTISKAEHGESSVADTTSFASLVRPPMTVQTIVTPSGGHNFNAWGLQLPHALDWLSARLAVSR